MSELNNTVKERAHLESLHGQYDVWRGGEVESVEKEWEKFRDKQVIQVIQVIKVYFHKT